MQRSLLALDLDGTLLDTTGRPHPHDVLAVRAALTAGVSVTIVTGRLYSGTRASSAALGLAGAVGCADGSHVVKSTDHTTLFHSGVSGAEGSSLRAALSRAGLATFVFAEDAIGHDHLGVEFVPYVRTWSNDIRPRVDVFQHELWDVADGVTAVVGLGPRERVFQAARDLARDLTKPVHLVQFPLRREPHVGIWAIMARAAGCTKGTAVRWIAEREGIALKDVVCVGDWVNDLPMFEVAGRSFAMGQAPDEVKARATDVLTETSEAGGGVAAAVAKAFGIVPGPRP
jgi:hydroxymethylpyrimidine pyrophosphatase-like HAD family hydrolase